MEIDEDVSYSMLDWRRICWQLNFESRRFVALHIPTCPDEPAKLMVLQVLLAAKEALI